MKININRSFRKSISLRVVNCEVIVKAPFFTTKKYINDFISKHKLWIEKKIEISKKSILSDEEIKKLKKEAKDYIPARVKILAKQFGFIFNKIRITSAKTRWGSCSSKKYLNFSYRLMSYEKKVIDYVIIHELSHLKHMNHSKSFWKEVAQMMPDYKMYEGILKGKDIN